MKFLKDKKTLITSILFLCSNIILANNSEIIPSQGFSTESILRGILGISFLIFITYILSNNKKAINWTNAIIGLSLQLLLAILILKVSWVKSFFEGAGKIFIKIFYNKFIT